MSLLSLLLLVVVLSSLLLLLLLQLLFLEQGAVRLALGAILYYNIL